MQLLRDITAAKILPVAGTSNSNSGKRVPHHLKTKLIKWAEIRSPVNPACRPDRKFMARFCLAKQTTSRLRERLSLPSLTLFCRQYMFSGARAALATRALFGLTLLFLAVYSRQPPPNAYTDTIFSCCMSRVSVPVLLRAIKHTDGYQAA